MYMTPYTFPVVQSSTCNRLELSSLQFSVYRLGTFGFPTHFNSFRCYRTFMPSRLME